MSTILYGTSVFRARGIPLTELDATDRTPSRLPNATPTGVLPSPPPPRPAANFHDPTRTRRRGGAAPAKRTQLARDDMATRRLAPRRRVRRSPRLLLHLFASCLFLFVVLHLRHRLLLFSLRFGTVSCPLPLLFASPAENLSLFLPVHLSICSSTYVHVRTYTGSPRRDVRRRCYSHAYRRATPHYDSATTTSVR